MYSAATNDMEIEIRLLETPAELRQVEDLQRVVWPGNETEIVPVHMLRAAVEHGGLVIGAFDGERLIGFVFGFPGLRKTPHGLSPMHASHMAGIHPDYRDRGLGFRLKRAQWQMVRAQGLDLIQWTYDPLLSRNARLNIAKLGAVCSTYIREYYGELRDGLNAGIPTDRLLVDWWVNTPRVRQRLSTASRRSLDLAHFLASGAQIINPSRLRPDGWPEPMDIAAEKFDDNILLLEIPSDFPALRRADPQLGLSWRLHSRHLLEELFRQGFLITDFVFLSGTSPRSFYVLSHGESTF
ncbi:MAG: GNAT family N-acetyltransferase [Anaerolineae bacterium]|nr:MAG: GNAT family N-acetyltransferase [Anaerolineae bacterium]